MVASKIGEKCGSQKVAASFDYRIYLARKYLNIEFITKNQMLKVKNYLIQKMLNILEQLYPFNVIQMYQTIIYIYIVFLLHLKNFNLLDVVTLVE